MIVLHHIYVSFEISLEQASYTNVAAQSAGAKCSGSSSGVSMCGTVLDKTLKAWDSAWVTSSPATGQKMSVQLADTFTVVGGRVMQRFSSAAQIKTLKLDFGNNKVQEVRA